VLNAAKAQRGVTLIELAIGLGIVAVLFAMAAPGFRDWIQNTQIRASAEAMRAGLQLARAESVRRNSVVGFSLATTLDSGCAVSTSGTNWIVSMGNPAADLPGSCGSAPSDTVVPRIIQVRPAAEGSANAVVLADQASILFNGLGRVTPVPAGDININITNSIGGTCAVDGGPMRCLRVIVSVAGQVRMCDPARASTDPQGC
jgi:type IV fimbrial biogenesis protein FimT